MKFFLSGNSGSERKRSNFLGTWCIDSQITYEDAVQHLLEILQFSFVNLLEVGSLQTKMNHNYQHAQHEP